MGLRSLQVRIKGMGRHELTKAVAKEATESNDIVDAQRCRMF